MELKYIYKKVQTLINEKNKGKKAYRGGFLLPSDKINLYFCPI